MLRVHVVVVAAVLVSACGSARYEAKEAPSVTFPAHFAEGEPRDGGPPPQKGDGGAAGGARGAGEAASGGAPSTRLGFNPDPAPLNTANQWDYSFVYSKGVVTVASVRRVVLPQALPTPRRFGRFAVELRIGKELVDRVRFDFPLLGGEAPPPGDKRPLHDLARFGPGADSRQHVLVPDSDRATSAVLIDRLTGESQPLAWPPPSVGDGGV